MKTSLHKTNKQIEDRIKFLKSELDKAMPSVITAIGFGFYPANYQLYEGYAQEYVALQSLLNLQKK